MGERSRRDCQPSAAPCGGQQQGGRIRPGAQRDAEAGEQPRHRPGQRTEKDGGQCHGDAAQPEVQAGEQGGGQQIQAEGACHQQRRHEPHVGFSQHIRALQGTGTAGGCDMASPFAFPGSAEAPANHRQLKACP
jgi:hypothetical protein